LFFFKVWEGASHALNWRASENAKSKEKHKPGRQACIERNSALRYAEAKKRD
jgi:hypothetical protein